MLFLLIQQPAPPSDEPQWPPRSPHEAFLSTTSGREKLRRMAERTSPSPSPLRNGRATSALSSRYGNIHSNQRLDGGDEDDDDEDEDEETLQLKLQEIQARLKLKKLQQKDKPKKVEDPISRPESAPLTNGRRARRAMSPIARKQIDAAQPQPQATIIPVSPVRKLQEPVQQTSPSRVLLGIDKGLKASDVSLKRAPSLRRNYENNQTSGGGGGYLSRSRTPNPNATQASAAAARPMSFNERLTAARTEEDEQMKRQERIRRIRANGFGISQEEMERFKKNAVEIPDEQLRPAEFSREEILAGTSQPQIMDLQSTSTSSSIRPQSALSGGKSDPAGKKTDSQADAPSFEPFSEFHLSKRIIPHPELARQIRDMKIMFLKDLLRLVKSPDYELPAIEQDIVVFGIIASKSDPRHHQPNGKIKSQDSNRTKYMVLSVVDLKWEIELFLFGEGFTRFWKVPVGTVVAILNPNIMPPPASKLHTGKFSLTINSGNDSIIEVGIARDLGFCKTMKSNGQLCNSWCNKRRTEFCEYHQNEIIAKTQKGRIEVNQFAMGPVENGSGKPRHNSREMFKPKKPSNYDRESHSLFFATKTASTAQLIDGVNYHERKERQEAVKRRLIAKEKETKIMKELGKVGKGAGRDYMRLAELKSSNLSSSVSSGGVASSSQMSDPTPPPPPDARALGVLAPRGAEPSISLSPIKRKRPATSSQTSSLKSTTSNVGAFGWGSSLESKLSRMKDGENFTREKDKRQASPVRKKTRFVTEKGIREAGRESLGEELTRRVELDDDDELIIVG